jgi:hypothetical protein
MENAQLRLGLLEYVRITEKASIRILLRVDRYIGEDRKAHLLSVFGNDSDVGAITAAVHERATFNLAFRDGTTKDVSLGEHASCHKGFDSARSKTSRASSASSFPGASYQWERRADDPVALSARGSVGRAGEFPGIACRSGIGRITSSESSRKARDRGTRRHRLPA